MTLSLRNLVVLLPILSALLLLMTPYLSLGLSSVNLAAIWGLLLWMVFIDISLRRIVLALSVISAFMLAKLLAAYFANSMIDSALLQISAITLLFAFYPMPKRESAYSDWATMLFLILAWASAS